MSRRARHQDELGSVTGGGAWGRADGCVDGRTTPDDSTPPPGAPTQPDQRVIREAEPHRRIILSNHPEKDKGKAPFYLGTLPFLVAALVPVALLSAAPGLVTWLPTLLAL